jgi:MFS family permease
LICLGLLAMSAASLLVAWSSNVVVLDVGRFAQGLFGAVIWAGAMAWLMVSVPEDRKGAAIGTAAGAGAIGALIGPAVGTLAGVVGADWLFTGTLLLTLPLCLAVSLSGEGHVPSEIQKVGSVVSAVVSRPVLAAFAYLTVPALGFGCILVLAPLKVHELGGGGALIAAAFIAAGAVEAPLGPLAGHWSDRSGRRVPYLWGLAVFSLALAVMATTNSLVLSIVVIPFGSIGGGLFISPAFAIFSDAAAETGLAQSHAFALSNTAFSVGLALGAFLGGVLAGAEGIGAPYFVLIGAFALLAIFASRGLSGVPERAAAS